MNKKELWLRLRNYHFGHIVPSNLWENINEMFGGTDASTKAFADKIARKHHWSHSFALRAVKEYKKFVYLGVTGDFHITPSKAIDVVWHEHILFSKAYREFCDTIIEQTFDHYPELIPLEDQTGRFNAQYMDTLELYKVEFGVDPPADVWGISKFDKEKLNAAGYESKKKKKDDGGIDTMTTYYDYTPLHDYFDGSGGGSGSFPEFSGFDGGSGGGGGASGDWGDGHGSDNSDSGNSSDSGSDGGSDGGGCSGGCGGCGGGD